MERLDEFRLFGVSFLFVFSEGFFFSGGQPVPKTLPSTVLTVSTYVPSTKVEGYESQVWSIQVSTPTPSRKVLSESFGDLQGSRQDGSDTVSILVVSLRGKKSVRYRFPCRSDGTA